MLSHGKVIETHVLPEAARSTPRRFGARINRVDKARVSPMAILIDSDTRVVVQLEIGPAGAAGSRTLRISDTGAPARRVHDFVSAMRRVEQEVYGAA